MTARRTYTGRKGRVYGFVTGVVFACAGGFVSSIAAVRGDLIPEGMQRTLVDLAPWLSTTAGPELSGVGLLVGSAFGGVLLLFGLYHVIKVFVVDEYSITLGSSTGP